MASSGATLLAAAVTNQSRDSEGISIALAIHSFDRSYSAPSISSASPAFAL
jgi:hypothetical protein